MNLWTKIGYISPENYEVEVQLVEQADIEQVLKIANEFFLPWMKEIIKATLPKKEMRLYTMLLSVTFSVLSHF